MRQPAEAAEGRRGEEGAARREACGPQLRVARVEHGADAGREGRALDRDPPVALDEHEQDVLAPQARKQPVAGSGAEAVVGDLAGERRAIRQAGHTACTSSTVRATALEEATGAPTTRRATQTTPSAAAARSAQPRWPAVTRVTRCSARTWRARSATMSTTATATATFALDRPIASRSVSMPIPTYLESSTGWNGRSNAV